MPSLLAKETKYYTKNHYLRFWCVRQYLTATLRTQRPNHLASFTDWVPRKYYIRRTFGMVGVTWLLVAAAVVLAFTYSWWKHRYWATRGVHTQSYLPFLGHGHKLMNPTGRPAFIKEGYEKFIRNGHRFYGIYNFIKPELYVGDPELMRHILIKDFDSYADRRHFVLDSNKDKITANFLSIVNGEKWKNLRTIMSPTFSSGKMKGMFPLVCKKADELVAFCLKEAQQKPSIDMKFNFGRFTMDTIASCAFGIECNSLVDERPIFAEKVEQFFKVTPKLIFKFTLLITLPKLASLLGVRFSTDATDFFEEVSKETMAARRKGERRGDFLDLLLEAGASKAADGEEMQLNGDAQFDNFKKGLDDTAIASQCVLFLAAGFDTTASTLAFASYLLAKNPEIQRRLREEVKAVVDEHGDITYQGIMEAKYLDSCLMETLRLYPPATFLERLCIKDNKLPGTDFVVEAGTMVGMPVQCIHRDPKYWPDPDEFRPERFLPENRGNITNFTHMPFGMGPRNCIAMRFALMEAKIALAKLLLTTEMEIEPGFELEVDEGLGILRPKNGVNMVLTPIWRE